MNRALSIALGVIVALAVLVTMLVDRGVIPR